MAKPTPLTPDSLANELALIATPLPLLSAEAATKLCEYLDCLLRWNKVMNLVGVHSWEKAVHTLLIDSLMLAPFLDSLALPDAPSCWDPGAGAGLPGIPLRIIWQRGNYMMIEAREKRALFVANMLAQLSLPHTQVYRGRLEEFVARHTTREGQCNVQEQPDLVVSKAFMPWRELLPMLDPWVKPGGIVVLLLNEAPDNAALSQPLNGSLWRAVARHSYTLVPAYSGKGPASTMGHPVSRTLLAVTR